MLVGESERSFSNITRNSFGVPFADYKKYRDCTEPWGNIGSSLAELKKLIPKIEESADAAGNVKESVISEMKDKLSEISSILGYPDINALLLAYGFTLDVSHGETISEKQNIIPETSEQNTEENIAEKTAVSVSQPTEQDDTNKRKALLSQLCSQLNTIVKEQQVESESDEYEDDEEYLYTGFEDEDEEDDAASRMVNVMFAQHRQLTIRQVGEALHFDAAFAVPLDDRWEFYHDTEKGYPALVSCVDSIAEGIRFYLKPFAAAYPGAVREAVHNTAVRADQGVAEFMLYESDDVDIGLVVISHEDDDYDDITFYKACFIVRVGSYSVLFDSLYEHYRNTPRETFIADFRKIGSLFGNMEVLYKSETISAEITEEQIDDIADQLFGEETAEDDIAHEDDNGSDTAISDALEQMTALTESAENDLQKLQNALEVQKQMLKAEERTDYTFDLTEIEIRALFYMTLLLEYENGTRRTSDQFCECYKDDFASLSEHEMRLLYNEFSRDVYAGERNDLYEDQFREMPFETRFYYAVENAFYTTDLRQHKSCQDFSRLFGKQWFSNAETDRFYDAFDRMTAQHRDNTDAQFSAIDQRWLKFDTLGSALVISLQDKDFAGYDPHNVFMQDCGACIAAVKLKSDGALAMSVLVNPTTADYWGVDYRTIWDAALRNLPYDQRSNPVGLTSAMARTAHDKALTSPDAPKSTPEKPRSAEHSAPTADTPKATATVQPRNGNPESKILSCISSALFAAYGILLFAMDKYDWWERFILYDRAAAYDYSVFKPIMGAGGLLLAVTALMLFLYARRTTGRTLSIAAVLTGFIGAIAVDSVIFAYPSSEWTARLVPQNLLNVVLPLLCMIASIICIRTRKYKPGFVTSFIPVLLRISPLLHTRLHELADASGLMFSLGIITFSTATFMICMHESKQISE